MREFLIFCQDPSGSYHNKPTHFKWTTTDRSKDDIVFYTDTKVSLPNKIGKIKIAWMFEPEPINAAAYHYIRDNFREFDYVFTWDKELAKLDKRFIVMSYGEAWIHSSKYAIYPKTKLVSMVASGKRQLQGHHMRHEIIEKYRDKFDIFGKGYNPVDSLLQVFADYMFTVVVENTNQDCNFTEKLITPLLCGTVPIYFGCPSIGEHFDTRGMICFNEVSELESILNSLSVEKYQEMLPYVQINFERAKGHQLPDDSLYNKLLELKII